MRVRTGNHTMSKRTKHIPKFKIGIHIGDIILAQEQAKSREQSDKRMLLSNLNVDAAVDKVMALIS